MGFKLLEEWLCSPEWHINLMMINDQMIFHAHVWSHITDVILLV